MIYRLKNLKFVNFEDLKINTFIESWKSKMEF